MPRSKSRSVTPIFRENLFFVSPIEPEENPNTSDIPFRELADHPVLKPSVRNTLGALIDQHAVKCGIELQGPPIHTPYHMTMLLIRAGITSAILPYSAVHDLVGDFVTARKIVRPEIRREVSRVTPAARAQSVAARRVSEAVDAVVTELWKAKKWRGELLIEPVELTESR